MENKSVRHELMRSEVVLEIGSGNPPEDQIRHALVRLLIMLARRVERTTISDDIWLPLNVGDFPVNSSKIIAFIRKANKEKADLVVFPELCLCGYPPEDLLFKNSFLKANKNYLGKVRKYIKPGVLVILGFVYQQRGKIFNRERKGQHKSD